MTSFFLCAKLKNMKDNFYNNQKVYQIIKDHDFCKHNLQFVVLGYCDGLIDKECMAQFLHWVCQNGLDQKQTVDLTSIMLSRGKMLDMSDVQNSVDKHSTGGVSDSTTLIVVPLFALLGFCSLKMSGGALGHTGGTADKMTVFDGININLDDKTSKQIAKKYGGCFCCQTDTLAPIDKKIYALRDQIGAVDSIPLIASSIMSKKLAMGAQNIVLDVKYGDGALVCDKNRALELASLMQKIGESYGRNTRFVLGDMSQPLGNAIGDFYEVMEVLWLLCHFKQCDLIDHAINIVCKLSDVIGLSQNQCRAKCLELLQSGKVFEKLEQIVLAQGGTMPVVKDPKNMQGWDVCSKNSGKVVGIKTKQLGLVFHTYKQNGAYLQKRIGQDVKCGESLIKVFGDFDQNLYDQLLTLWEIK